MKRILLLTLICVSVLFTGCKKTETVLKDDIVSDDDTEDSDSLDNDDLTLDTARRQALLPEDDDSPDLLWGKFLHALEYEYYDVMAECLDAYAHSGESYDMLVSASTLQFLNLYESHGYETGAVICFFENNQEHPTLLAGDIIVEIDGIPVDHEDAVSTIREASNSDTWEFTILRPQLEEPYSFEKRVETVRDTDPRIARREIIPVPLEL